MIPSGGKALPVLFLIFLSAAFRAHPQEEPTRTIRMGVLEAQVTPQLELTLPSGDISQRLDQTFNNLLMVFNLHFNILDSSIDADLGFSYPVGFFVPTLRFFQSVDLENLVAPRLQGGELSLLPSEKFISRNRGIGLELNFELTSIFAIVPSFLFNETFMGN
jgi:hypothetical protein